LSEATGIGRNLKWWVAVAGGKCDVGYHISPTENDIYIAVEGDVLGFS
jgi:hypothetical protein